MQQESLHLVRLDTGDSSQVSLDGLKDHLGWMGEEVKQSWLDKVVHKGRKRWETLNSIPPRMLRVYGGRWVVIMGVIWDFVT